MPLIRLRFASSGRAKAARNERIVVMIVTLASGQKWSVSLLALTTSEFAIRRAPAAAAPQRIAD